MQAYRSIPSALQRVNLLLLTFFFFGCDIENDNKNQFFIIWLLVLKTSGELLLIGNFFFKMMGHWIYI